jgi:hypothetical protein
MEERMVMAERARFAFARSAGLIHIKPRKVSVRH